MRSALPSLILAVLAGGVAGALGGRLVGPPDASDVEPPVRSGVDLDEIAARLDGIEARLRADARASLEGTGSRDPDAPLTLSAEDEERIVASLAPRIDERVAAKVDEIVEREGLRGPEESEPQPPKPKLTLAEASAEVGLSAGQESALREVYSEYERKLFEILVGEDGDEAQVRADLEMVKNDPSSHPRMAQKYLPRVMSNLAGIMSAEMNKQVGIVEAVGPEMADKLDDYDIEEAHPFGIAGGFMVGATMER